MKVLRLLALLVWMPVAANASWLDDQPNKKPADEAPRYEFREDHDPDGIGKFYMGREIAQVMGHLGAGWLERPERVKEEEPKKLYELLKVKAGDVIADIGAGSGYHTFPLAERVGRKGKVYAVDIQPEMLAIIKKRMKEKEVTNVEPVQGTETDPKLPEKSLDLILMVDVYHEFNFPWEMTTTLLKGLKPGGRMVFVEFRKEDEKVPIKLVHKMTEKQVLKEMEPHPLKWLKTDSSLPWQHVIIFEKKAEKNEQKNSK
jgi:protein-L-isoaspartate O-methyltransferase